MQLSMTNLVRLASSKLIRTLHRELKLSSNMFVCTKVAHFSYQFLTKIFHCKAHDYPVDRVFL